MISELIKDTTDSDSTILLLILQNNASKAIVIKNLNVFFKQTGVDVTKEEGGKRRTASFDICAVINYHLYNSGANISNSEITSCGFFIQRNVVSGLLAAGPDIVGNRKYAHKIIKKNAEKYLRENQFFSF